MGHRIALNFEDDVTRFIDCAAGETVAEASYRVGINIPLDCRDGACGTCKGFCESGAYDGGDYIDEALTGDEAAQGYVLPCQMRPRSDCVVRIAAASTLCKTRGASFQARIGAVTRLSASTLGVSLQLDPAAPPPGFLPGQYVNIRVPGTDHSRSYSFSSAPGSAEASFLMRDIPQGLMSTWLRETAVPGAEIEFTGPIGAFYLRDIRRPLLFLAGGTGLAPFLSMLGRIVETGSDHPIHLVYGVTSDADLVEVERLERFAAQVPGFSFACCVAAPDSTHPRKGYVTAHIAAEHLHGGEVDIYLCGPPPMVEAVRADLRDRGVTPANFYTEKFAPSGMAGRA